MTMQVVAKLSNQKTLCIGEITTKEAELNAAVDPCIDGFGIYLVAVDAERPSQPGTVIAKFVSEGAASVLANFFRVHGHLEPA